MRRRKAAPLHCRKKSSKFKARKKSIPALKIGLIMRASRLVTEGCLHSIFRHGAGSGGRGMTVHRRCGANCPAVQAACVPARQPRATGPLMAGASTGQRCRPDLGPKRWIGGCRKEAPERSSTGGHAEQTYKHRARDALGLADLRFFLRRAVWCDGGRLDVARRRGPRVRLDPWRPARPRYFSRAGGFGDDGVPRRRPNQQGRRSVGFSNSPEDAGRRRACRQLTLHPRPEAEWSAREARRG